MKAMILAAGAGTRLLPFTRTIPKPLFTLSGRPVLDLAIEQLCRAGADAIIINTHHLHHQIEAYLARRRYPVPVLTRHEPAIRGTGGGIKDVSDFMDDDPFLVINGDIVFNIDLREVYDVHAKGKAQATLVLCDDPAVNTVLVDPEGYIRAFDEPERDPASPKTTRLTFTGIQVIDPEVCRWIPDDPVSSIISAYRRMIENGKLIKAWLPHNIYWKDIGTPERYQQAALDRIASDAFQKVWPKLNVIHNNIIYNVLKGDGSDRLWYRLKYDEKTLIAVNHGIKVHESITEIDAFLNIGMHLYQKKIPVPRIYQFDTFSGWVIVEDAGVTNLQDVVTSRSCPETAIPVYEKIISALIDFSIKGHLGFNSTWAYQTAAYDIDLILEKECRYFFDACITGFFGWNVGFTDYEPEFMRIAEGALSFPVLGLMHRDFQSRNIIVTNGEIRFIDFQGARTGPIQYDLASLLIDPYVGLPIPMQNRLLDFCITHLRDMLSLDERRFRWCYLFCALSRNLQILGAFCHLSRAKKKTWFERYIPGAILSLNRILTGMEQDAFPKLKALAARMAAAAAP